MTYFFKFLIQGLSKYYKENYHDFKRIFQKKNSKKFYEYFLKINHKSNQKVGGCGSCYSICTDTYCILKILCVNNYDV
jgi:hypothetical protein